MAVFWVVAPRNLVEVSEVLAASVISILLCRHLSLRVPSASQRDRPAFISLAQLFSTFGAPSTLGIFIFCGTLELE
jgi:hypothetical protein